MATKSVKADEKTRHKLNEFLGAEKIGATIYSLCKYLCFGNMHEANSLFKQVIDSILKHYPDPLHVPDLNILRHFHPLWLKFAKSRANLQANNSPLRMDWKNLDIRQAEWTLFLLTPEERAVVLYRLLLNFPLSHIQEITESNLQHLASVFHQALRKVA